MEQKEYRKLPGRGLRSKGAISVSQTSCTLWLGADHLLQVDSQSGYAEDYKRFYFRDIQAVIVRKTSKAAIWNGVLVVAIVTLALMGWSFRENPIAATILYSFAGLFAVCLVINAARGATSICHLKTAVQLDQLPSLKRLRIARKTLAIIQPLLEQAQGSLHAEEINTHIETVQRTPPPIEMGSPVFSGQPLNNQTRSGPKPFRGPFHMWFFGVLLFSGLLDIAHIFYHPVGFMAFEMLISTCLIALAVIALAKQQGTDLNKTTQTVTWISAIYVGLLVVVGYFEMMAMTITDPAASSDQWTMVKKFSEMEPFENPWLLATLVTNIFVASSLGVLGLILARKRHSAKVVITPPPVISSPPTL
ncbi:MAG: hypothetical protein ABIP71_11335 [Verrucomicrobiota bacterium]